jgi:hypothetical protein
LQTESTEAERKRKETKSKKEEAKAVKAKGMEACCSFLFASFSGKVRDATANTAEA